MTELKNWWIENKNVGQRNKFQLSGFVYGHPSPKCSDGMFMYSTEIQSVADKGSTLEICTRNTTYTLNKSSVAVNRSDAENISNCLSEFLGEAGDDIAKHLLDYINERRKDVLEKVKAMVSDTFYIELSSDFDDYYYQGFYKDYEGTIHEIEKETHVGTLEDSVILRECGLQYFSYNNCRIKFYNTLYEEVPNKDEEPEKPLGFLHNAGTEPIFAELVSGKELTLLPGFTVSIYCDVMY